MTFGQVLYQVMQQFCWPKLRRTCVAAITYADSGVDESTWDMAPFEDGRHFTGEQITRFLRENEYEVLVLQHWPTGPMSARLREFVPGIKLLGWVPVEAISGSPWLTGTWSRALHTYLSTLLLPGTDGRPIDIYYGRPKSPIYAVDMLAPSLPETVANTLVAARVDLGLDGWFIDSMTAIDFFGTAPNQPARRDRSGAWRSLMTCLHDHDPEALYWGNTVSPSQPRLWGLDVMFAEQFFVNDLSVPLAVARLHDGLCLNTERSYWAGEPTRWRYLALGALIRGLSDLYVCTAWTGQQLFEPEWK